MNNERTLQGSILKVARRFAAGMHMSEDAVRIAVVSRRIAPAFASVCVDNLECVSLPEGAVVNGDFVDCAPIVAVLREAFGWLPVRGPWRLGALLDGHGVGGDIHGERAAHAVDRTAHGTHHARGQ